MEIMKIGIGMVWRVLEEGGLIKARFSSGLIRGHFSNKII